MMTPRRTSTDSRRKRVGATAAAARVWDDVSLRRLSAISCLTLILDDSSHNKLEGAPSKLRLAGDVSRHALGIEALPRISAAPLPTARRREQLGIFPAMKVRLSTKNPRPSEVGRGTLESRNGPNRPDRKSTRLNSSHV